MNYAEASSFLGWMSIGCWIIVYSPQLIENYRMKSGEGLSVAFVAIWFAADLSNLVGAALAHLLPTVIILPIYYCLCDLGLLFQIYHYRHIHPVHITSPTRSTSPDPSEASPLLPSLATKPAEKPDHLRRTLTQAAPYFFGILFIFAMGAAAHWIRGGDANEETGKRVYEWRSQTAGWFSALLYFISRIPQILKNVTTKCAGLSPVLFTFAMAGNVTYVASILVISTELSYLTVNASWLAGSVVTIILDIFVLAQFVYYRSSRRVFVEDPVC